MGEGGLSLRMGEGMRVLERSAARALALDFAVFAAVRALPGGRSMWVGVRAGYPLDVRPEWTWGVPIGCRWVHYEIRDEDPARWFAQEFASLPDLERRPVPGGSRLVLASNFSARAGFREIRTYLLAPR